MGNTPFLKQVADAYAPILAQNRQPIYFIFPNKRSATFFESYLKKDGQGATNFDAMTMGEYVAKFSTFTEASRYEQLFILFNEYSKIVGENHPVDFDRFVYWGEMLINDFNDVDRYLIDPEKLFVNVERFKEIATDYLTEEQRAAFSSIWGDDEALYRYRFDNFWKHFNPDRNSATDDSDARKHTKKEFVRLWEVLLRLYHAYHAQLNACDRTTSGAQYCLAAKKLSALVISDELRFSRIVFIGFSLLTASEKQIFTELKKFGIADFYWDLSSSAFSDDFNTAARIIRRNAEAFPSLIKLPDESDTELPSIEIIGVPGNTAQVKVVGKLLNDMLVDKSIPDPDNAINTAIVLPDEPLFMPLLHSLPKDITKVNVTMGVSLRNNPIAALLFNIVGLQENSRISRGEPSFFRNDIALIINNPVIAEIYPEETEAVKKLLTEERLMRVSQPSLLFVAPALSAIFRRINDEDFSATCDYLSAIVMILKEKTAADDKMRLHFLLTYEKKLQEIKEAVGKHGIAMSGNTAIRMVQRAISSDKIHFKGEPLKGLQIMGVLETRALDFDNVIMLSMNEKTFPKKHYTPSFIPDLLRRAYSLPTADSQEAIFAYYFYRLISRAKNVKLLYDARTVGTDTGEMSRYLSQLLYLFNYGKIAHKMMKFSFSPSLGRTVEVKKTPDVMAKLMRYASTGAGSKNLSASSLKEYINCPLNFYLRYVEGLNPHDGPDDFVDAGIYGNIVHETMQTIYDELKGSAPSVTVTDKMLESLLSDANPTVDRIITAVFNEKYLNKPKGTPTPLKGEYAIYGRVFKEIVKMILLEDRKNTPFEYFAGEADMTIRFKVNDLLTVNINQKIDRIDKVNGVLRLVDYKTGSDELTAPGLESLFVHGSKNVKAIFQLMLYCCVYAQHESFSGTIKPVIYSIHNMAKNGVVDLTIVKKPVADYRDFSDDYLKLLRQMIKEIFDSNRPFTQSPHENSCRFCNFGRICGRGGE